MKLLSTVALMAALSACAAPPVTTSPAPQPAPTEPSTTAPATVLKEAPRNWQLLDPSTDGVPGISAERAERELLAGKQPQRTVLVAVIDGGVDTAHVDLAANIWRNPREIPGNGKDDDNNGYVDDVYGWNFIGGADGKDVRWDNLEVTRLYARCTGGTGTIIATLPADEKQRCPAIIADYRKAKANAETQSSNVNQIAEIYDQILPVLRAAAGTDSLTTERVSAIHSTRADVNAAQRVYLELASQGINPKLVEEAKEDLDGRMKYGLNPAYDSRQIVGDNYANTGERRYGNRDVMGPDAKHGTHVSGIIGAIRGNNVGIDGVAPAVKIMAVRAVPDGDERDKDIANAIRYAVDNGANVINMSFGKGYSPQKPAVDSAVKYADAHGVLMVHAAGNESEDVSKKPSYPTPMFIGGGRAQNWIEVGASSWHKGDSLVAGFSNYGQNEVDVFAPGDDILSTTPGGNYEREGGTSMASPVVAGLAAMIMAYYPNLNATEVKKIILDSATRYPGLQVLRPGAEPVRVPFATLSTSGGIVNAFAALQLAAKMSVEKRTP